MSNKLKYTVDILDDKSEEELQDNYSESEYSSNSEYEDKDEFDSKSENIIVGIDLGTTNSCVSVWRNGNVEIIPDEYGNRTIPSTVSFTNRSKYVGTEAKNQKQLNPEHTYYEVKRIIGRRLDDISVQNDIPYLTYNLNKDKKNNIVLECSLEQRKKTYTPEEISALVLMKLKNMAEAYLKQSIDKAVITVPAYFNDSQRQATKDAATIAGLECVRIINEPTAAALSYGLQNRSLFKDNDLNILVYDCGGGTLDCSLLNISDGLFDVLGSTGNTHLGGADFDNKLMGYCMKQFKRKHKIDKIDNISSLSLQKIKKSCESVKKILSTNDKAPVVVENFYDNKNLYVMITKKIFENLCKELFLLCIRPVDDLLNMCEMTFDDIDDIILVGGATRIPLIQENLRRFFKGKSPNCNVNPDEVVAVGAGIQAYMLSHKTSPFAESIVLLDIIPLSLGVETIGGVMNVLIPRNSTIPITRKRMYTTDDDYQSDVTVKIYEGERKMTKDNFFVGQFNLANIKEAPRGVAEIEITFSVDVNGIISVTAVDKNNTDNKKQLTVTGNKGRLSVDKINDLVFEAKNMEIKDKLEREKKQRYYEIEDLCSNIIININDENFKLKEKDNKYIEEDVKRTMSWLKKELYYNRDVKEYERITQQLKKKYGTLILKTSHDSGDIKSISNNKGVSMTTVFGDEDEEDEETNIYEKIVDEEIGITDDMGDEEKKTLRDMRTHLVELCYTVYNIISKDNLKMDKNQDKIKKQNELKDIIDDILLWAHVSEKIKKAEYKEKMDIVNNSCNNFFEELVEDVDDEKHIFNVKMQTSKDELEQLCYTISSTIKNNMIPAGNDNIQQLQKIVDDTLNWMIEVDFKNKKLEIENKEINHEEDNKSYKQRIDEINKLCDTIFNSMLNINIHENIKLNEEEVEISNNEHGTSLFELKKYEKSIAR